MHEVPWQLKLFRKSLKKKMKISLLGRHFNDLKNKNCLLVTCGDNNGAMNYHIRNWGGRWTWVELEDTNIKTIEELLQEPVIKVDKSTCSLPFHDSNFDCVLIIDCHEHLQDPHPFNLELARVTKTGGKVVVSVPNGDERKFAVRIKRFLGMNEKEYGHVVLGYEIPALSAMLEKVKLKTVSSNSYSKLFTEMLELCINFAYVKILSKKGEAKVEDGTIAPTSKEQLSSVAKSYRLYSFIYPVFWIVSRLDSILFFATGYAVILEAEKE